MGNYIISILNYIIAGLGTALQAVILLLPESPFGLITSNLPDIIFNVEWLFPVTEMLATLQAWVAAILVYYGYQVVLRWVKAIE